MSDVCHTEEQCKELYAGIDPVKLRAAKDYLREQLHECIADFKALHSVHGDAWFDHIYDTAIAELKPEDKRFVRVVYSPHFRFGMQVRNTLRTGGFGEEYLGVHNLDCVYLPLLTDVVSA